MVRIYFTKFWCTAVFALFINVGLTNGKADPGVDQTRYDTFAERLFQKAVHDFKISDYASAAKLFDSLIRMTVIHQRTTAAYIMEAKALFSLSRFDSSVAVLKNLQERFPATSYTDDLYYTLGIDHMMLQQPRMAADQFIRVLDASPDSSLRRKAEDLLRFLMKERLNSGDMTSLFRDAKTEDTKDLVALALIEHDRSIGDDRKAQSLITERLRSDSGSVYRTMLIDLRTASGPSQRYRIGVLLPLMAGSAQKSLQQLSAEMLDGMDFALKEYTGKVSPSSTVTIDVRDAEMDSNLVVRAVQEWASSPDMLCVIGPLFSPQVAAASPIANRNHLPLITPTATTTGLTLSGSYVFQLSPDYQTRGKAIARYAFQDMGYRSFIVLATTEPMGKSGEGFAAEVTSLGGNIVSAQTFSAGVTTLKDQCVAIRHAVLGNDTDAEDFDIPVTVDGIYVAIDDAEEMGIILPQLLYFNIKGGLLGNNEWYDKENLDLQRKLVDGIILTSDTFLEDTNARLERFRSEFRLQKQKKPTKYTLIGYDVMNVILSCLSQGSARREDLQSCLSGVRAYPGLHSMITLSPDRVNSNLFILQYHHGEIHKIADTGTQ